MTENPLEFDTPGSGAVDTPGSKAGETTAENGKSFFS
jgi:hypothetical protein